MSFVDPQKPTTWVKFTNDKMCEGCRAGCCSLPLEVNGDDLVRLELVTIDEVEASPKKVFKKLHKKGFLQDYYANRNVFMMEQHTNGDCYFLDQKTRRCTVYDKRPTVCRSFPRIGPRPGFCPKVKMK